MPATLPRSFVLFAALAWLGAIHPAHAQYEERLPVAVAKALKAAAIPQGSVAVVVQQAEAVLPRVSVNAAQAMNPASLMKLLTTYAALELLGPAYTWKTEAWMLGKLADGVLEGDLLLQGGGDPRLTFEQFWLLLRQLRARGLRDIRGDLVLDRSLFEAAEANGSDAAPGAFDNQPLRPYNVSPDALLLNFKSLRLQFVADAEKKTLAVLVEPRPANLDIINLVKPASGSCGDWKEQLRADLTRQNDPDGHARLILTGRYPLACGEKNWNLGVLSHPQYVEGVFRQLWQELGGTLSGGLREAVLPAEARLLASIESPPLAELIRDINKFSNNVMARQLFLTLGAQSLSVAGAASSAGRTPPARAADADAAIRAWLAQKQLRFPELVLENGSGLSRQERIAAENLARLLAAAWKSPLMPEMIASLPLSGVDGTMRKRLQQNGIAAQAHIKTGSLEGVKSIAGYVLDSGGKWQIVVFLVNHPNAAAAQPAQDALLDWVYARGR
ncbi:MAG: D-alanyl-D-alanine carboxypeptidase/D-alanyl-D-alanine-endopeptidase, partial [Pseudomonadota bacterium]